MQIELKDFDTDTSNSKLIDTFDGYNLYYCKTDNGDLAYILPRLEEAKVLSFYKKEYHIDFKQKMGEVNHKARMEFDYFRGLQKKSQYENISALTLNNRIFNKKVKILDYGCGSGGFVRACRDHDYDIIGIDYGNIINDEVNRDYSNSFKQICNNIDLLNINESFDVFTLHDTIEHLHHPCDVLRSLDAIGNNRYSLIINTPDIAQGLLEEKRNWKHTKPLEHPWLFSREFVDHIVRSALFDRKVELLAYYCVVKTRMNLVYEIYKED